MAESLTSLLPLLAELNRDRRVDMPLEMVARSALLSPSYAQRTFTRLVGESPKQYQLRLRLESAAVALVTTPRPVIDVALSAGFNNHETFSRAFKRHYRTTPSAYRRRAGESGLSPGLVEQVGPCVGLFGATHPPSQPPTHPCGATMTYQIEKKTLTETPVIFSRRRGELSKLAELLGELLPSVFAYAMEQALPMAGPPYVRYVEQSPAFVTVEAGMPLVSPVSAPADRDDIEVGVLPGGPAASTIHTGPYDTLGEGHVAIDLWMAEQGLASGGSPWEVYLTDPGEVPDPADWQTEIVWPLAQ